jgi:hypothetical protein
MRKTILSILSALSLLIISSPVAAGAAQSVPVAPHTPAGAIMRAHALIALRMVEQEVGQELYLVETDGEAYTVILRDAGVEAMRRSGRYHILSLPDRFGILVSVTSADGGEVACRIFDGDGQRIVEDDGGMVARCEVK